MSLTFEIIESTDGAKLEELRQFVEGHTERSIWQHPDMFLFYQGQENHAAFFILARNEQKQIKASLLAIQQWEAGKLRKHLTQRCLVLGVPLIAALDPLSLRQLLLRLQRRAGHKNLFIQFRPLSGKLRHEKQFIKFGFEIQERINIHIPVKDIKTNWQKLSESKRRQIRKSRQKGAYIQTAKTEADVKAFYAILKELYQKKIGKPLPPVAFFKSLLRQSNGNHPALLLLVKHKEKVCGGILCALTPEKCIYEWFVCGLDREFRPKGIYPSVMATWAAIEYALENNIPEFNMMGAGKPGIPYGVREFKLRFGGRAVPDFRYNKVQNGALYQLAEFLYNVKRWIH